jgi:hypothetical protein
VKSSWLPIALLLVAGCNDPGVEQPVRLVVQWSEARQLCILTLGDRQQALPLESAGQRELKALAGAGRTVADVLGSPHIVGECVAPITAELQRAGFGSVRFISEPPAAQ